MKLILNNGTIINDAPVMSEKTRNYLSQFWKLPTQEEIQKEREKCYISEYKGAWKKEKETIVEREIDI